jgi:hypothetical protein
MTQSPAITLAAGAVGALIGLAAPVINAITGHFGSRRRHQQELAAQILELFASPDTLDTQLGGAGNGTRRRLFVLAAQLDDKPARAAIDGLIDVAARPGATENDIYPEWHRTVNEVSRVSRGGRR